MGKSNGNIGGIVVVILLLGGMLVMGLSDEIGLPTWATIAIGVVVVGVLIKLGIEQFSNLGDDGDDYDRYG